MPKMMCAKSCTSWVAGPEGGTAGVNEAAPTPLWQKPTAPGVHLVSSLVLRSQLMNTATLSLTSPGALNSPVCWRTVLGSLSSVPLGTQSVTGLYQPQFLSLWSLWITNESPSEADLLSDGFTLWKFERVDRPQGWAMGGNLVAFFPSTPLRAPSGMRKMTRHWALVCLASLMSFWPKDAPVEKSPALWR